MRRVWSRDKWIILMIHVFTNFGEVKWCMAERTRIYVGCNDDDDDDDDDNDYDDNGMMMIMVNYG